MGLLIAFVLISTIGGQGQLLNWGFTPLALAVGLYLYARHPAHYVGFVVWMWILVPLVRRLADFDSGYHVISPVMLAGHLVTAISAFSIFQAAKPDNARLAAPYLALLPIIFYGYLVGIPQSGFSAATYALLNWLVPLFFAIHILLNKHIAGELASALFKALAWGALLGGAYGVWQYFSIQPWDAYWVLQSGMSALGDPTKVSVRTFGTMNVPGIYAQYLAAGLLASIALPGAVRWLAAAPALTGLLLSLVRSSWGGLVAGAAILIARSPHRGKILVAAALISVLTLAILAYTPFGESVGDRLMSVTDVESDNSFNQRAKFYESFGSVVMNTIVGVGLGSIGLSSRLSNSGGELGAMGNFDSGIMEVLYTFGAMSLPMFGILVFIIFQAGYASGHSQKSSVAFAIGASMFAQMVFVNQLAGVSGMLLLPMFALVTALRLGGGRNRGGSGWEHTISLHRPKS